jgi:CarboxypepD_reg-like domain
MKNLSAVLMLLIAGLPLAAQRPTFLIWGKVIDSATRQPLSGASALCDNTTHGTTSNNDGLFGLRLPNGGYDLIISYTGYEKRSIRISNTQNNTDTMIIALNTAAKALEQVAIVASNEVEDGLVRFGKFFTDNFLGTTPNAAQCTIMNPQTLRFFYTKNKKRHRLKVTAREDVFVRNNALGYTIRYQLDSFSYDYNTNIGQYTGNPFFIEMDSTAEVKDQWLKNRAKTYLGSRLHFMTALYDSIVTDEGFMVEKLGNNGKEVVGTEIENLYDSSIYMAQISWDGRYRISYNSVRPDPKFLNEYKLPASTPAQVTLLDVSDGFFVEENGYFYEQYDVVNTGYWAWKKLAEALPYNYVYE